MQTEAPLPSITEMVEKLSNEDSNQGLYGLDTNQQPEQEEFFEQAKETVEIQPDTYFSEAIYSEAIQYQEQQPQLQQQQKQQPQPPLGLIEIVTILLIFCVILLALNVMWTNLFTTLLVCFISFPILRWFGKI